MKKTNPDESEIKDNSNMKKTNPDVIKPTGIISNSCLVFYRPLEMRWTPKEDITAYELALCIPFLFRLHAVYPYEIDKSLSHFRHFEIIDHNKY